MDDIDILCIGAMTISGVCGPSLCGSGAFVFMISKVGAVSSPGLVVGEAASGAGVCEGCLSLEEVGDDCASCVSTGGGIMGVFGRCLFGGCSTLASESAAGVFSPSWAIAMSDALPAG